MFQPNLIEKYMTTTQLSSKVLNLPVLSIDLVQAAKLSEGFLENLDEELLRQLELQYRQWLFLNAKYPTHALAPTLGIDKMWHLHMLHPRAYMKDSMSIFGFILDHNPGFGKEPGTLPTLLSHFASTSVLWEKEFGQPYSVPGSMIQGVVMCDARKPNNPEKPDSDKSKPQNLMT